MASTRKLQRRFLRWQRYAAKTGMYAHYGSGGYERARMALKLTRAAWVCSCPGCRADRSFRRGGR